MAKVMIHVIRHPVVQHKLTLMRRKEASTNSFRRMLGELSTLMPRIWVLLVSKWAISA